MEKFLLWSFYRKNDCSTDHARYFIPTHFPKFVVRNETYLWDHQDNWCCYHYLKMSSEHLLCTHAREFWRENVIIEKCLLNATIIFLIVGQTSWHVFSHNTNKWRVGTLWGLTPIPQEILDPSLKYNNKIGSCSQFLTIIKLLERTQSSGCVSGKMRLYKEAWTVYNHVKLGAACMNLKLTLEYKTNIALFKPWKQFWISDRLVRNTKLWIGH